MPLAVNKTSRESDIQDMFTAVKWLYRLDKGNDSHHNSMTNHKTVDHALNNAHYNIICRNNIKCFSTTEHTAFNSIWIIAVLATNLLQYDNMYH